MTQLTFAAPLAWPPGQPVTPRGAQKADHGFPPHLTLEEGVAFLDQELAEMGSTGVLHLDIEQPLVPRLRKKVGSRTGACLHLRYMGGAYVIACDQWQTIAHNVYALHLGLRQWRNIERWGLGGLDKLLAGMEAGAIARAAAGTTGGNGWMEGLGLGPTATLDDAVAVYHRRAKQAAQDGAALTDLNRFMEEAREYFSTGGA